MNKLLKLCEKINTKKNVQFATSLPFVGQNLSFKLSSDHELM